MPAGVASECPPGGSTVKGAASPCVRAWGVRVVQGRKSMRLLRRTSLTTTRIYLSGVACTGDVDLGG